jgi:hypothetical protein
VVEKAMKPGDRSRKQGGGSKGDVSPATEMKCLIASTLIPYYSNILVVYTLRKQ